MTYHPVGRSSLDKATNGEEFMLQRHSVYLRIAAKTPYRCEEQGIPEGLRWDLRELGYGH